MECNNSCLTRSFFKYNSESCIFIRCWGSVPDFYNIHTISNSFTHLLTYFHSFTHLLTYFHSFTHLLTYFHSFTHLLTYSLTFTHLFTIIILFLLVYRGVLRNYPKRGVGKCHPSLEKISPFP